jgi:L-ascorbate metabolism protein UlaG (beta-lactamase superfamily)
MARTFQNVMILAVIVMVAAAQTGPSSVTLTWLGQSTFVMDTSTGLKVLLDPTNPGAYNAAPVDGVDVVTVTHEHGDHNYIKLATGSPLILRGLTADDFAKIDQTIKGVHIRTVAAYHDAENGGRRGKNALFVFEMPGLRIVHLGDLGHALTAEQVSAIGPVDVLMTPMAGGPTVDARTAIEVMDQLHTKVAIPMHYATPAMAARAAGGQAGPPARGNPVAGRAGGGPMMAGVDEFLKMLDPSVTVEQVGHQISLASGKLPSQRTVLVMKYE